MEDIIARHVVKPSSPTPVGIKTHKLSSLDQVSAPFYVPLIFFFQNDQSKPQIEISQRLRESLSQILTIFYPLAGIIKENSFVDCNDRGAELVEARVHAHLTKFTQDPKIEELKQLLPVDSLPHNDDAILLVKVCYFDCGGFSVGVCLSHKLGDTASFVAFMNAWAATCRRETSQIITPSFDLALHFPPGDLSSTTGGITRNKIVTKRVVFDREKLEKLKKEAAPPHEEVKHPSRVEALTVFIWRTLIEAHKAKSGTIGTTTASFIASHSVNLRPRTVPPIADRTFGNCVAAASAVVSWEEDDSDGGVHLSRLRTTIRGVDDDYINNNIKGTDQFFQALEKVGELFKPENCFFTSWWRFPMYDVDFGYGKPVWVCTATIPATNIVILLSTPSGDGIEAWVNASDDDFFRLLQANCNKLLLD